VPPARWSLAGRSIFRSFHQVWTRRIIVLTNSWLGMSPASRCSDRHKGNLQKGSESRWAVKHLARGDMLPIRLQRSSTAPRMVPRYAARSPRLSPQQTFPENRISSVHESRTAPIRHVILHLGLASIVGRFCLAGIEEFRQSTDWCHPSRHPRGAGPDSRRPCTLQYLPGGGFGSIRGCPPILSHPVHGVAEPRDPRIVRDAVRRLGHLGRIGSLSSMI
jgi:hypothetical protein